MATAESRTTVAMPRLSKAISARYRTEPAAARSVGPAARDSSGKPRAGVKPWPGRMTRPASTDPPTAMVPVASTRPATRTALAASTADRRGIAVSVMRIMPVLYSPLIASTARMATTAWLNSIPVRLSLGVSTGQAVPVGHRTAAVAAALTATVSTMMAASSQAGPDTVRSLVIPRARHPAGPSLPHAARRTGPAARRAGPGSWVPPAEQDNGQAQGERGVSAQYGQAGPRRQREVTGRRRVEGGDLRVLRCGLLDGEGGGRGDPQQPVRGADRQHGTHGQDVRQHDRHDDDGDRGGAAPQDSADRQGEDGDHGEQRRGAGDHPDLGQPRHREHVRSLVA